MEMRKFIIEMHTDGTISVVEYIPPEDQSLANYQAGCKDTRTRIENILRHELARAQRNAGMSEYGPAWEVSWSIRSDAYEFILEKIRQTILK
jgi:hypothetical protein